jgi:transcriptional regulator with XRE-family HTH domain
MRFNKKEFAALLERAKGKRSINKYGIDSGVDPGYISRLLRGLVETPPSAMIIKKLSDKAQYGVTDQLLLAAAGYIDQPGKARTAGPSIAFFDGGEDLTEEEEEYLRQNLELFRKMKAKRDEEKNK